MMVTGLSWSHTERLELSVGDTARWRIINASAVDHPMQLHGPFLRVETTGRPEGPPLALHTPDGGILPLVPISATRFQVMGPGDAPDGLRVVFEVAQGRPAGLRVLRGEAVLAELERIR
jgi:FtsP/CotA-like multicopper oxidase with cupredoxin domain